MTTDPQNELLTEVDEANKVIGPIPRGVAHQSGKYYRTIYVMVRDSQGRVLLQKRSATKDLYPNCLDLSVGGHVEWGSSYLETAVRELKEELGLTVDSQDLKFLKEVLVTLPQSHEYFHVFEYWLKPGDKLVLATAEVADISWVTPDELKSLDFYPRPAQIIRALYS